MTAMTATTTNPECARVITRRQDGNAPTPAITAPGFVGATTRIYEAEESMMQTNKRSAINTRGRNRHEPIVATRPDLYS